MPLKSWSPAAASGAAGQGAKGGLGGLEQGSALLWAENGVQLKSTNSRLPPALTTSLQKQQKREAGRQLGSPPWLPARAPSPPVPEPLQPQVITRQESVATSRSPSSPAGSAVGNPRPGSSEGWEGRRGSAVLNSPTKLGSSRWPTGGERSPSTPTRWAGGRRPGLQTHVRLLGMTAPRHSWGPLVRVSAWWRRGLAEPQPRGQNAGPGAHRAVGCAALRGPAPLGAAPRPPA